MSDNRQDSSRPRCSGPETMSIHTHKITDSCRDKDCIEDLRVYLTKGSQALLDTSANARVRSAELICTYIDVEPVAFNRTHYCVDTTFCYRVLADTLVGSARPATLYGLAIFSKRAVLCGEDSRIHIYRSDTRLGALDGISRRITDLPTAVVEVLDPMVLNSRVKEVCDCPCQAAASIPAGIGELFDDELVLSGDRRRLFVTLGQFSIIRLERSAQLVVPVVDYAIPTKECCETPGGCPEDPCEIFSRIPFPEGQFAPRSCDKEAPCENGCGSYRTACN